MNIKYISYLGAAVIPLLAGCASKPIAIAPVGPGSVSHSTAKANGYLKVFSDTETREIGDNTYYSTHTGYNIYDEAGKRVEYVANHVGSMDEAPMRVSIPAGNYNVVAQSASYGRVTVPVEIQAGKTTLVHLNRDGKASPNAATNDIVRLPDGEIVGMSGSFKNP